eukprot:5956060-Pyramimonas_sp.AAC.1
MEVNGEDEEVDFRPDSPDTPPPAQERLVPDSSQQGDLPAQDVPPAAPQEPFRLLLRLRRRLHLMSMPG